MKPIKLKALFCCDYVIRDKADKISLIGIFSNINVPKLPGGLIRFVLVGFFETKPTKQKKTFKLEIKIKDPDANYFDWKLPPLEGKIEKDKTEALMQIDVVNLKFKKVGKYTIEVYVDKSLIGSAKINVNLKK